MSTSVRSSAIILLLGAALAHAARPCRGGQDIRDARMRACASARPRQLISILPTLPGTASQATGSLLGVTVTRASGRACVRDDGALVKLGENAPCVEAQGVLVERGVTNLVVYSEELSRGTTWNPLSYASNPVITGDTNVAPDGTSTAETLLAQANVTANLSSYHIVRQGAISVSPGPYIFSLWLKAPASNPASHMRLYINDQSVAGAGAVSCSLVGTWARCASQLDVVNSNAYPSAGWFNEVANVSGQSVYMWQAQFTTGSYLHADVLTTASAASSADDVVTVSNPISGKTLAACLGATFKPTYGRTWQSRTGDIALLQLGTSGSNNSIAIKRDTNSKVVVTLQDGAGGTRTFTSSGSLSGSSAARVAFCYVPGGGSVHVGGSQDGGSWAGSGTGIITLGASLTLGRLASASSTMLDGHVSAVCMDARPLRCL